MKSIPSHEALDLAERCLQELTSRRGFKQVWDGLDGQRQQEIEVACAKAIIAFYAEMPE